MYTYKDIIYLTLVCLLLLSSIIQVILDFSFENMYSTILIVLSICILLGYLYWNDTFSFAPLSSLMLLGFGVSTLFGALVFQSLSFTSVNFGLRLPLETFSMLALFLMLSILTHYFYLQFHYKCKERNPSILREGFARLGLYNIPSTQVLWLIGIIGVIFLLLGKISSSGFLKNLTGFLVWAPFLIPVFILTLGHKYGDLKKQIVYLSVYLLVVILIGIAFNNRAFMLTGLVNIIILIFLQLIANKNKMEIANLKKFFLATVLLFAAYQPLSDLMTAMAIARSDRGEIPLTEMVQNTFSIFLDDERINDREKQGFEKNELGYYSESYVNDPIMSRFVLTKFHDNSLYYTQALSDSAEQAIKEDTFNLMFRMLPQPLLDFLEIPILKSDYYYTMGDNFVYYSTGYQLGGYKLGSVFVQGKIVLGWYYIPFFIILLYMSFYIIELWSFKRQGYIYVQLPAFAMLMTLLLSGISSGELDRSFSFLLRGFWQSTLLFLLIIWFLGLFKPKLRRKL